MLAGPLPALPVLGDDRLTLRPSVRQVGVGGLRGLGGAGLGSGVVGAEWDDLSIPVVIDVIS
jgi:hypothetical protein